MIEYNFPVIINGRWKWVRFVSNSGNKYEVALQHKRAMMLQGVKVQGDDMSQCWHRWL